MKTLQRDHRRFHSENISPALPRLPVSKKRFPMPLAFLNLRWPQLGRGPVPVAEGLHLKNRVLREFLEAEDGKFGRNHVNLRGYAQDIRLHTPGLWCPSLSRKINPRFFFGRLFQGVLRWHWGRLPLDSHGNNHILLMSISKNACFLRFPSSKRAVFFSPRT